jgi:hypothetical protein
MFEQLRTTETDMRKHNSEAAALNPIHCRAICDEIGERLRQILKVEAEIPQRLLTLLEKLDELESAPSIVPTMDELSSLPRYNPTALIRRSTDPLDRLTATSRKLASVGLN